MQVQKQIDELLALRASEWLELLPDVSDERLREFEAWLCESRLHVKEFLELAEIEFCLSRLDPQRQQDVESLLKRLAPPIAELPARAAAGPFLTSPRARRWKLGRMAIAASLVLVLGATVILRFVDDAKRYTTAIGEQRIVELADASVITLNADSQIQVRLEDLRREVDLGRGEALFQVAHDPRRPFRVRTRAALVEAVGTQFNIDDRVNGDTRVSVLEGKVRAMSRSGSELLLSAGQEADIRLDGSIARPAHPNVSNSIAWRQHRLIFDNATLEEIAVEFNRHNPSVQLRLEGLQGDGHRFDGSFEATDPQSFIEMLGKEPDLAIERREGEVVIRRR
jgi:transmembrane sensor